MKKIISFVALAATVIAGVCSCNKIGAPTKEIVVEVKLAPTVNFTSIKGEPVETVEKLQGMMTAAGLMSADGVIIRGDDVEGLKKEVGNRVDFLIDTLRTDDDLSHSYFDFQIFASVCSEGAEASAEKAPIEDWYSGTYGIRPIMAIPSSYFFTPECEKISISCPTLQEEADIIIMKDGFVVPVFEGKLTATVNSFTYDELGLVEGHFVILIAGKPRAEVFSNTFPGSFRSHQHSVIIIPAK